MSAKLKPLDLTGAAIGFTGTIDLSGFLMVNPHTQEHAYIWMFNESGCGLDILFKNSNNSHYLPAGAWCPFSPTSQDGSIQATVTDTLQNPQVSTLSAIYYAPGEEVPQNLTLGNSPVGIGGVIQTSSVQTLSNEGSAANTLILDIGDAALTQLLTMYSDHFTFKVDQAGVVHGVLKGSTTGNPAQIGQAGDVSEILGQLLVDQAATFTGDAAFNGAGNGIAVAANALISGLLDVVGASSLDNGNITTDGAGLLNLVNGILNARGSNIINFTGVNTHLICPGNAAISFDVNGVAGIVTIDDTTGLSISSGINFNVGRIKDINNGTFAASGTVNHGLSGAPAAVLLCPDSGSSTWTFGASSYTSTQFTGTLNSALTTKWLAYR